MHKHHPIRRGAAHLRLSGIVVSSDKLRAIVAAIKSNNRISNPRNYGYICGRNAAIDVARRARRLERARKLQTELYAGYTQLQKEHARAHTAIEHAIHSVLMRNHSAKRIAGIRTQLAILRIVTLEGGTYPTRSLRYRKMSRDLWDQNRRRGALLILQDLPPEAVPYLTLWRGQKSVLEKQAQKLDRLQKRLTV